MNFTAIAIIGIICWTIIKLTGKDKKSAKQEPAVDQDKVNLHHQVDTLKERIAVLEAIVTDDKYSLKREIDSLSRNRAA